MEKIERPDFKDWSLSTLENWFDIYIEPINKMIEEAVVVEGWENSDVWETKKITGGAHYQALLIDIQPLKKESCADVLRDLIKKIEMRDNYVGVYPAEIDDETILRAKKALENNDE